MGRRGRGVRSIFYTPAQPQRSSRLEGRRHTRQESRGESVSLRSTRLWGGDLHSVRAASAGHIETDAHEPIGLSAARLRSQLFFFFFLPFICLRVHHGRLATFCRPHPSDTDCVWAATSKPPPLLSRLKNVAQKQPIDPHAQKRGDIFKGRSCSRVWRQFSRKCHHGTGRCDCKHAIPIRR